MALSVVSNDKEQLRKTGGLASTSIYNANGKKYQVVVKTSFACKYRVWLANKPAVESKSNRMLN
jgi:hypothetical protein